MKKISVWHKNHHLQQVTEDEGTAMHSFSSHVEKTNDLSQLSLSPAFWLKSLWSVNVKWREIKNSCQAVDVILGKWEVEENSWISSSSSIFFFFFFDPYLFFPDFALVSSISPSSFSPKFVSVNTSLGHDKSWHSGAEVSEALWQKGGD